jgi:hypothetical protein
MIDSRAELILIHRFVVDAAIVVGGSSACRQWISIEQRPRHRIHAREWNRVVRKRRSRRTARRGVVDDGNAAADGFREDALALQHGRYCRDDCASDGLPLTLVIGEEERAVAANRPAKDAAELIPPELRLDWRGGREEVARVQRFVTEELERAAA